jgi:hypothetical protein
VSGCLTVTSVSSHQSLFSSPSARAHTEKDSWIRCADGWKSPSVGCQLPCVTTPEANPRRRLVKPRPTEIPATVLHDAQIPARAKGLLAVLASHQGDNGEILISQGQLAKEMGVTTRTIGAWLVALRKRGLVTWTSQPTQVNRYLLGSEKLADEADG